MGKKNMIQLYATYRIHTLDSKTQVDWKKKDEKHFTQMVTERAVEWLH